jgi:hypothetical protein
MFIDIEVLKKYSVMSSLFNIFIDFLVHNKTMSSGRKNSTDKDKNKDDLDKKSSTEKIDYDKGKKSSTEKNDSDKGKKSSTEKDDSSKDKTQSISENKNASSTDMIKNPLTGKFMPKDSSSIKTLITRKVLNNEGKIIMSDEELRKLKTMIDVKKCVTSNRMFDGIAAYMQNMKMREIYDLMKLCEEEIRSPKRENDYQELLRDQKRNGDITKEITQMRNESSSSK